MGESSTLWLFNIAMEIGPFIDGLPIKYGDFPWQTVKQPDGTTVFYQRIISKRKVMKHPRISAEGYPQFPDRAMFVGSAQAGAPSCTTLQDNDIGLGMLADPDVELGTRFL